MVEKEKDIVERLRKCERVGRESGADFVGITSSDAQEAADEIERLREILKTLRRDPRNLAEVYMIEQLNLLGWTVSRPLGKEGGNQTEAMKQVLEE